MIELYTDGSCKNRIGGYAVIMKDDDGPITVMHGSARETTNNQMELAAINDAVAFAKYKKRPAIIYSDSEYAINCITVWNKTWEKNGWKTSAKKPVKNADLIKHIIKMLEGGDEIIFRHVKAHDGNIFNECADEVANYWRLEEEFGAVYEQQRNEEEEILREMNLYEAFGHEYKIAVINDCISIECRGNDLSYVIQCLLKDDHKIKDIRLLEEHIFIPDNHGGKFELKVELE